MKHDQIISSFKLFEYCRDRYWQREVHASAYVGYDEFYYMNRLGKVRLVRNKTEVWVGREWPTIVRRRG